MLAWLHESATDAVHDTTPPGRFGRVAFSNDEQQEMRDHEQAAEDDERAGGQGSRSG